VPGVHIARIDYDFGTLAVMKKRRDEARRFFAQARAAESQSADSCCSGSTPRWRTLASSLFWSKLQVH
jgi:hypothetical protein